jgi:hypothetical protein
VAAVQPFRPEGRHARSRSSSMRAGLRRRAATLRRPSFPWWTRASLRRDAVRRRQPEQEKHEDDLSVRIWPYDPAWRRGARSRGRSRRRARVFQPTPSRSPRRRAPGGLTSVGQAARERSRRDLISHYHEPVPADQAGVGRGAMKKQREGCAPARMRQVARSKLLSSGPPSPQRSITVPRCGSGDADSARAVRLRVNRVDCAAISPGWSAPLRRWADRPRRQSSSARASVVSQAKRSNLRVSATRPRMRRLRVDPIRPLSTGARTLAEHLTAGMAERLLCRRAREHRRLRPRTATMNAEVHRRGGSPRSIRPEAALRVGVIPPQARPVRRQNELPLPRRGRDRPLGRAEVLACT